MAGLQIMIVAGEASGDLHGAKLVGAMKKLAPDLSVCGLGGRELAREGVELLYDASKLAVVGLLEVLAHLKDIRAAMQALEERLRKERPHLLILIDYPDFNLMLAKKAKRLGIPVFYYISPQVWAWRSGRIKKIRRLVDRMAVILPFEQEFYRQRGMEVDFVGHPLMDAVTTTMTRNEFLEKHGIAGDRTVIGILPGSRRKEISSLLPTFIETGKLLARQRQDLVFLLPLASTLTRSDLEENGLAGCGLDVKVISDHRYDLMAACDAVMAASGTVTLELAILGVPMVVAYRIAPLTYFLGRRLIKIAHVSLVNLVAENSIVPELLQEDAVPEKIQAAMEKILDEAAAKTMRQLLRKVRERLGAPGASKRVAEIALELAGKQLTPDS